MLNKIGVTFSFILLAMLGFQVAEAKRFGSSSNHGYSRSAPTQSHNSNAPSNAAQKKSSMGTFGKILAAAGLAALFAWLFSSQGMTGLLVLGALIAIFVFFMRKKAMKHNTTQNSQNINNPNENSPLQTFKNAFKNQPTTTNNTVKNQSKDNIVIHNGQLPDGTPESVFNHQALNLFHQLQALNNKEGLEKLKSYITEDLYQSTLTDIQNNEELAQFKDINCKVIDCDRQPSQWITSVMFVGNVKEDSKNDWQKFEEIWYFNRKDGEHLWQVSGIQQF